MTSTIADRYARLAEHFTRVVDAVPDDRWNAQSPCEEWTAIDVVRHVATTEAEMLGRMPFAPDTADDLSDPLKAWPVVRDRIQAALENPDQAGHSYDGFFGPTTFEATIDSFFGMDLVVHAWDLARAAGLEKFEPIDADEMATLHAEIAKLGDNVRQPGVFGPALDPPADADEQTRFLALIGRRA